MTIFYYIRNKDARFLGNSPVWYAKNGCGYTAYVQGAEIFEESRALKMVKENPEKWEAYRCDHVNERLHLIFDDQDKNRLGTSESCGWSFGYAQISSKAPNVDALANTIRTIDGENKMGAGELAEALIKTGIMGRSA